MKLMIYTVTFNPALDVYGSVDRLCLNEKNYVQNVCRFSGGNGINVARMLTRLNEPCVASGFLGGDAGEEIKCHLSREGVQHSFVKIKDATRLNVTVTQRVAHNQTRLCFPGPIIHSNEILSLEEKLKRIPLISILMLGGSLPRQYPVQRLKRLMTEARRKCMPVVLDAPSTVLRQCIRNRPTLIKPNLHEFQELTGRKYRSVSSLVQAAHQLTRYIPLICISSVAGGAVLVSCESAWFGKGRLHHPQSCVGAGDSMVAGMLCDLNRYYRIYGLDPIHDADHWSALLPNMLRRGIAAGMATALQPAGHLGESADVSRFLEQVSIEALPLPADRCISQVGVGKRKPA